MNRITQSIAKVIAGKMRASMTGARPMRSSVYDKIKKFDYTKVDME